MRLTYYSQIRCFTALNFVADVLSCGAGSRAIAEALFLSESTIKLRLRDIMTKFEVNDRGQVAVVALRSGLVH
jgi:DNA-binding NarL/FixJ family response regulator